MWRSERKTESRGRSSVPRTRERTRSRRRPRATTFMLVRIRKPLRSSRRRRRGLARLPADTFLGVLDALGFVRLWRPELADRRRHLAEQLAIGALERDDHHALDLRAHAVGQLEGDGMRIAEGQEQEVLARLRAVTDAVDLEHAREALADALDHVGDEHAREPVQALGATRLLAPREDHLVALDLDGDLGLDAPLELALRPLGTHESIVHVELDARRQDDRHSSDS